MTEIPGWLSTEIRTEYESVRSPRAMSMVLSPSAPHEERTRQSAAGSNVVSLVFMYFKGYWISQ